MKPVGIKRVLDIKSTIAFVEYENGKFGYTQVSKTTPEQRDVYRREKRRLSAKNEISQTRRKD